MTALWQKLSGLWKNRKPIQVPLTTALRPVAQFAGAGSANSRKEEASTELREGETEFKSAATEQACEPGRGSKPRVNARRLSFLDRGDDHDELDAQMRALREDVASLAATLSSEQADRHSHISSALKDLASHASAHNQSMVQVHEDLQLMTQTEREAVSRISELSQAASRYAAAQEEAAETVRRLETKVASEIEALSTALTRTRQTIIAVTLIATGGLILLIPMIIALLV